MTRDAAAPPRLASSAAERLPMSAVETAAIASLTTRNGHHQPGEMPDSPPCEAMSNEQMEQHLSAIYQRLSAIEEENRERADVQADIQAKLATVTERLNTYARTEWVTEALKPMNTSISAMERAIGMLGKDVGTLTEKVGIVFTLHETLIQQRTEQEKLEHAERIRAEQEKREQQEALFQQQLRAANEMAQKNADALDIATEQHRAELTKRDEDAKNRRWRIRIQRHAPWIVATSVGVFTLWDKVAAFFHWLGAVLNGTR
jgi:DNA repair exonuclease SbcCD ATPase subunit